MNLILLGIYILLSVTGLYFLIDALIWKLKTRIIPGRVTGFQQKRYLGRKLPIVVLGEEAMQNEHLQRCRILKNDNITYLIRSIYEDDVLSISVPVDSATSGRIAGNLSLVSGLVMQCPLFFMIVGYLDPIAQQGIAFLLIAGMIIGVFLLMVRVVRYHY